MGNPPAGLQNPVEVEKALFEKSKNGVGKLDVDVVGHEDKPEVIYCVSIAFAIIMLDA